MNARKLTVLGLALCTLSTSAFALTTGASGRFVRLLTSTDGSFGGCMALLDSSLASRGLNCPDNWVSFSCSGDFASRSDAKAIFETAQVAFALGRRVNVRVTDEQTHNGRCVGSRVEIR